MDALSPELALVDERLATAARAALAPAPDVFATLERARAGDAVRKLRHSFVVEHPLAPSVPQRRGSWRRHVGFGVGAAAALVVTASAVAALGRDEVTAAGGLGSNVPARSQRDAAPRVVAPRPARSIGTAVTSRPTIHVVRSEPKLTPKAKAKPKARPKPEPRLRPTPHRAHVPVAKPKPVTRRSATPTAKPKPASRPQQAPTLTWPTRRLATYYRVRVYRVTGTPRFLFEVWTAATKLAVPATWSNAGERSRLTRGVYGWAVYPAFGELGEANDAPPAAKPIAGGHFTV